MSKSAERVKTGIDRLDAMLDGGVPAGSSVLIQGAPGVGKTTFGLQFLYEGAIRYHEPGLFVTFEEFPVSLYRDAQALGWDFKELERQRRVRVVFTSPEIFLAGLQAPESLIAEFIQDWNVRRAVIDSVSLFKRVTTDPVRLREVYHHLVNGLRREGITSFLTVEDRMHGMTLEEEGRLGYVVDGIILLRYVEVESAMQRALTILKMRGVNHDRGIYRFSIGAGGIQIHERFTNLEGILSGTSYHSQMMPAKKRGR